MFSFKILSLKFNISDFEIRSEIRFQKSQFEGSKVSPRFSKIPEGPKKDQKSQNYFFT